MNNKKIKNLIMCVVMIVMSISLSSCTILKKEKKRDVKPITFDFEEETTKILENNNEVNLEVFEEKNSNDNVNIKYEYDEIVLKGDEKYYEMSVIKDGKAKLYHTKNDENKKNFVIAINAGHGVKNGSIEKTFSHPDQTPKLSGGTNKEGEIMSSAISDGMVFDNGETESAVNLKLAIKLRDALLDFGYDVLMIREDENNRFDNVARTILANKYSNIHISLHFDSTNSDKGVFVILPINNEQYLSMEPVKSNYKKCNELGRFLIDAFKENNEKVWKDGIMLMDLTQISYSTIPTVDLELGDKMTDINDWKLDSFIPCIIYGIEKYYHSR